MALRAFFSKNNAKRLTLYVVIFIFLSFIFPQNISSGGWGARIISVTKEIIKGIPLLGLDAVGKELLPSGWTYFKPLLMPVINKLRDRNPYLISDQPRTESQAKIIGEIAALDFSNDRELQDMLLNNFERLQSGQDLILEDLNRIEGRIITLEKKVDRILALLEEGEERNEIAARPQSETFEPTEIIPRERTGHVVDRDGTFIAYASGVVRDTNTGLEWFVGPDRDTTWDEARAWVDSLDINGGGWRMPTVEELETLHRNDIGRPYYKTPLLKTTNWRVWAGRTEGLYEAWTYLFYNGDPYLDRRDYASGRVAFAVRYQKEW
jgi:hypothetical protein